MSSQSLEESIEFTHVRPLDVGGSSHESLIKPKQDRAPETEFPGTSYASGVDSKQNPTTNDALLACSPPPLRQVWDKLGKSGLLLFIAGTLVLLGCLGVLLFLWTGAERAAKDEDPGRIWHAVVLSDWTTRTMTISTAVMRAVITAQAALVTAMIAALFLESAKIELHQLPFLSLARAVRISPMNLLQPQLLQRKHRSGAVYSLVIIFSSIMVMTSQFISTILLLDFDAVNIALPENSTDVHLTNTVGTIGSGSDQQDGTNFYGTSPAAFWRFAEYQDHQERQEESATVMYTDTGITLRAAIPWVDADARISLRKYKGSVRFWNARVVCINPTLSNLTVQTFQNPPRISGEVYDDEYGWMWTDIPLDTPFVDIANLSSSVTSPTPTMTMRSVTTYTPRPTPTAIHGNFSYNNEYPPLKGQGYPKNGSFFNCSLPFSEGAIVCAFDTDLDMPKFRDEGNNGVWGFMVLNLSFPNYPWGEPIEDTTNLTIDEDPKTAGWSIKRTGSWATAMNGSDYPMFSISACFTDAHLLYNFNVTMTGAAATSEPKMGWIWNTSDMGWSSSSPDTSKIRRQLGVTADNLTLDSREILTLDPAGPFSEPISNNDGAGLDSMRLANIPLALSQAFGPAPGAGITYYRANDIHTILFLDILNTTKSPAYALQALITTLNQMQVFDTGYKWTYGYPASYIFSGRFSIPKRKVGLRIVMGIVATHIALTATTIVLFLLRTRSTLLGNAWQSVAQVVSDETMGVLSRADALKDTEIKKALSTNTHAPGLSTGVIRRRQNGRTEFGSEAFQ